ncbi:MAG TPA: hypothetical protein ENK15_02175 [Thermopetrobacter sp.]|nr:hypothetical protein [Thermopetrobacter sp.]
MGRSFLSVFHRALPTSSLPDLFRQSVRAVASLFTVYLPSLTSQQGERPLWIAGTSPAMTLVYQNMFSGVFI